MSIVRRSTQGLRGRAHVSDRHDLERHANIGLVGTTPHRLGPVHGEMAEWLKAHAWNACRRATVSWVRIPLSPPEPNLPMSIDVG
jgi:hypothetical protein